MDASRLAQRLFPVSAGGRQDHFATTRPAPGDSPRGNTASGLAALLWVLVILPILAQAVPACASTLSRAEPPRQTTRLHAKPSGVLPVLLPAGPAGQVSNLSASGAATFRASPQPIQLVSQPAPPRRPKKRLSFETHHIRQTWHQEPAGFDRTFLIRLPRQKRSRSPVVLLLHGNGGKAEGMLRAWNHLGNAFLVSAAGYQRSWNILGERSEAPDVAFLTAVIDQVIKKHPQADPNNVAIIGSSNGSGMINRLLIEVDQKPFQKVVCLVASMVEKQYHDGRFWVSSQPGRNLYDVPKKPTPGPEVLYFHGTEDRVVPYYGGRRGRIPHVSAQDTAYAWAQAFGHVGDPVRDQEAERIAPHVYRFAYPRANYTHYKLEGEGHGIQQTRPVVQRLIRDFLFPPPPRP